MLEWQRKITSKIKNLFESCSIMARQPYIIVSFGVRVTQIFKNLVYHEAE